MEPLTLAAMEEAGDDEDRYYGDPFEWEGVTVIEAGRGIRELHENGGEFARIHFGMIHTALILFDRTPTAERLLAGEGISVDTIGELEQNEAAGDHRPCAVWVKRIPGIFPTSAKLRFGWERVHPGDDDHFHALSQAGLDEWTDE